MRVIVTRPEQDAPAWVQGYLSFMILYLTKNQMVAAIISFCVITLHFFSGLISFIVQNVSSATRQVLGYFSALEQMGTLSRGELDTRPIVLYLSMTIVMLMLTHLAFQSRKWRL